ncbi:MAG TPA: MmcB family DNA repair protein [Alphaproteobacteria bacterium]|nr:MmcB family DNA repair protein [Alphaproteobacteria bacterium]
MTVLDSREASRLARGVCRTLYVLGYGALTEFTLRNGRRADVIGVNSAGEIAIVEIKTSEADFRADQKWPEYLPFCDSFFFAVPEGFPRLILPEDCGLMVADSYEGAILRPSPALPPLSGARRRSLVLSFAITASARLQRALDPEAEL